MKENDITKYFTQKDILRPVSVALLLLGFLTFYFGHGRIAYYISTATVIAGFFLFIYATSKHVSEDTVHKAEDDALRNYEKVAEATHKFDLLTLSAPYPIEWSAYRYDGDATLFRKTKKCGVISNVKTKTKVYFQKQGLLLITRTVDLTHYRYGESDGITDLVVQIPYGEIERAELIPGKMTLTLTNGKTATVPNNEWRILGKEGVLFSALSPDDMIMVGLCEEINKRKTV